MPYIKLEGKLVSSEVDDWTGQDQVSHPRHKLRVLTDEPVELITVNANQNVVEAARAIAVGQSVKLIVEVKSGKAKESAPAFVFSEDLTQRPKSA